MKATPLSVSTAYGGFRNAPIGILDHPLVLSGRKVRMVRDPRDALVSEYFSNAYSHSIPEGGEGRELMLEQRTSALQASVGEYVLRMAAPFRRTLRQYRGFLELPELRLYRYEEAILDKHWFLQDVCDHFGWSASDVQLGHILGWADVMPDSEAPTKFIRKVVPGDHREKLDEATITALDDLLSEELGYFGYD